MLPPVQDFPGIRSFTRIASCRLFFDALGGVPQKEVHPRRLSVQRTCFGDPRGPTGLQISLNKKGSWSAKPVETPGRFSSLFIRLQSPQITGMRHDFAYLEFNEIEGLDQLKSTSKSWFFPPIFLGSSHTTWHDDCNTKNCRQCPR